MKKIAAILTAAVVIFSAAGCDGNPAGASSGAQSAETSSTASFAKPDKVTHDGNNPGEYGGVTIDVTPDFIDRQSSLDSYMCEALWMGDGVIGVFYTYSEETMPNYFVKRLSVSVIKGENGDFSSAVPSEITEIAGEFPEYAAFDGGFAVAFGEKIELYDTDLNVTKTYEGSEMALLDVSESGNVLYLDGGSLKLDGTVLDAGLSEITAGALSADGTVAAVTDGAEGVRITASGTVEGKAELAGMDGRVVPMVTADGAFFAATPRAGVSGLTAVRIDASGESSEFSYGGIFENTYARGKVWEDGGKIYLLTSLTGDQFDFGNAEIAVLDGSFAVTDEKTVLDGGYHFYNRYSFSGEGKLAFTENVAAGVEIKDYLHIL